MNPAVLADAVLVVHALFVLWVVLGAVAVWRRPRLALLHLPALVWGIWIEASGAVCPLTPLEVSLRRAAGQAGYSGGFIEYYIQRYVGGFVYPAGLTRQMQLAAAALLVVVNVGFYGLMIARRRAVGSPGSTKRRPRP
ncbi:MAG: DUF2784 domain-containing protein [Mycobacterium sp.]